MSEGIALLIGLFFGALVSWMVTSNYYKNERCNELNGTYIQGVCFAKESIK